MRSERQLLVTGAGGFIGRALTLQAVSRGLTVRAANRLMLIFRQILHVCQSAISVEEQIGMLR